MSGAPQAPPPGIPIPTLSTRAHGLGQHRHPGSHSGPWAADGQAGLRPPEPPGLGPRLVEATQGPPAPEHAHPGRPVSAPSPPPCPVSTVHPDPCPRLPATLSLHPRGSPARGTPGLRGLGLQPPRPTRLFCALMLLPAGPRTRRGDMEGSRRPATRSPSVPGPTCPAPGYPTSASDEPEGQAAAHAAQRQTSWGRGAQREGAGASQVGLWPGGQLAVGAGGPRGRGSQPRLPGGPSGDRGTRGGHGC